MREVKEDGRVTLTPAAREQKILNALGDCCDDFSYMNFDSLSRRTRIERRQVSIDVRRMARKGLTQYGKGLWTDDGEMAGSGYAITDAGRAALSASKVQR
jgi:RIO-like serine/threonine protein kinase